MEKELELWNKFCMCCLIVPSQIANETKTRTKYWQPLRHMLWQCTDFSSHQFGHFSRTSPKNCNEKNIQNPLMWKFWIDMWNDNTINILIIYENLHKHKSFMYHFSTHPVLLRSSRLGVSDRIYAHVHIRSNVIVRRDWKLNKADYKLQELWGKQVSCIKLKLNTILKYFSNRSTRLFPSPVLWNRQSQVQLIFMRWD